MSGPPLSLGCLATFIALAFIACAIVAANYAVLFYQGATHV